MAVNYPDGYVWCHSVGQNKEFGWGLFSDCARATQKNPNPRYLPKRWNPLLDDADALRLAVKLKLRIGGDDTARVDYGLYDAGNCGFIDEPIGCDRMAATRRAIVRAAAEIGRTTGESNG